MLNSSFWNSRIKENTVTKKEKYLGHLLGPVGVSLLTSILNSYLNIYYTDVMDLSGRWNGTFLSLMPLISKIICVFTSLLMGKLVDRCVSPQGKARPWFIAATPFQIIGMICLFCVPVNGLVLQTVWVFFFYLMYYAVGNTAHSTSRSLMVSLSTRDEKDRRSLSRMSNAFGMVSGSVLTMVFPIFLLPWMGVERDKWVTVIVIMTAAAAPLMMLEYFYSRERVTEESAKNTDTVSFRESIACCFRSRKWVATVIYIFLFYLVNQLYSVAVPYYCNWVLGTYNDGFTQPMFYGLGNFPYMAGLFITEPLCRRFGRSRAMSWGYVIGAIGSVMCYLAPSSMPVVLAGQVIKTLGLIPANFLTSVLMADALDDVEKVNGIRCDGFSASVFGIASTVIGGIALFIFNLGLSGLGYIAPSSGIVSQTDVMKTFFILCVTAIPAVGYIILSMLVRGMSRNEE